jgi:4-hydroxythreonine-4-phosphate dehydrogenase
MKPLIVITAGDPAGIGPEIVKKALLDKSIKNKAEYVVIEGNSKGIRTGKVQIKAAQIAFANIEKAMVLLKEHKGPKALVTAPINKQAINKAGIHYPGHTEMLAHMTKAKEVAMMFSSEDINLALVTRHIPLKDVSKNITKNKIVQTTRLFNAALKKLTKKHRPLIMVAGLNPHASDSGVMGDEEEKKINPAIKSLKKESITYCYALTF